MVSRECDCPTDQMRPVPKLCRRATPGPKASPRPTRSRTAYRLGLSTGELCPGTDQRAAEGFNVCIPSGADKGLPGVSESHREICDSVCSRNRLAKRLSSEHFG